MTSNNNTPATPEGNTQHKQLRTICCDRVYDPNDGTVDMESWIAGYPSIHTCKIGFGCKRKSGLAIPNPKTNSK